MEFAVQIEGDAEGHWVLDVDYIRERFLTTDGDGNFRWVEISDCRLLRVSTPEVPRPVVMVQLPTPGLVVPR